MRNMNENKKKSYRGSNQIEWIRACLHLMDLANSLTHLRKTERDQIHMQGPGRTNAPIRPYKTRWSGRFRSKRIKMEREVDERKRPAYTVLICWYTWKWTNLQYVMAFRHRQPPPPASSFARRRCMPSVPLLQPQPYEWTLSRCLGIFFSEIRSRLAVWLGVGEQLFYWTWDLGCGALEVGSGYGRGRGMRNSEVGSGAPLATLDFRCGLLIALEPPTH